MRTTLNCVVVLCLQQRCLHFCIITRCHMFARSMSDNLSLLLNWNRNNFHCRRQKRDFSDSKRLSPSSRSMHSISKVYHLMNDLPLVKFKILKWSFISTRQVQNFEMKWQFKILELGISPKFCAYCRSDVTKLQTIKILGAVICLCTSV